MRKPDGQTVFLGSAIVVAGVVIGYLVMSHTDGQAGHRSSQTPPLKLEDIPFNGQRAYEVLERLCDLGPRPSGSAAMARQQALLTEHFQRLGAAVVHQKFQVRHPRDGSPVSMANLVIHWHPGRGHRILLCAHYDTRPFPDRDPDPRERRSGRFVGANDGASGVAVLAELGYHMSALESRYGVDFALFDGEEFIFDEDRDPYFLGSEYFARHYVSSQPQYRYRGAVLLDMVGDANLNIYRERYSMSWKDTRPLVMDIWRTASRLGVNEFIPRTGYLPIRDDHLKLHEIAKIPACDVIDFDYGPHHGSRQSYWHTTADTPDKCSALSLAKVGWVILTWLRETE